MDDDALLREGELAVLGEEDALSPEALADPLKTAGKVAVAAALATTLVAAPSAVDKIQITEPVPIVQVIDFTPHQPAPDHAVDAVADHQSVWKKVLKGILMALVALLTVAGIVFGALKGCAGTIGAPDADDGNDDAKAALIAPVSDSAEVAPALDAAEVAPTA